MKWTRPGLICERALYDPAVIIMIIIATQSSGAWSLFSKTAGARNLITVQPLGLSKEPCVYAAVTQPMPVRQSEGGEKLIANRHLQLATV